MHLVFLSQKMNGMFNKNLWLIVGVRGYCIIFLAIPKICGILFMTKVARGYKLMNHYRNQSVGFIFYLSFNDTFSYIIFKILTILAFDGLTFTLISSITGVVKLDVLYNRLRVL